MIRLVQPKRQFCRFGIHTCVPAVTLSFDQGARFLHWCERHASDADRYRADADTPSALAAREGAS